MLKAVIFDMDGVLIDSEPVHFQANKEILKEMGIDLSYNYYKQFIGSTLTHMWEVLKVDYNITKPIDVLNKMSEEYSNRIIGEEGYRIIKGACELIKMFSFNGLKVSIASSSGRNKIKNVIEYLGVSNEINEYVSGNEVENPKPHSDIFVEASKRLGLAANECIVIEDSENGVNAAKSAGMACIGFINPNSGEQNLSKADYLVEDFTGLDMSFFDMVYSHTCNEP